VSKGTSKCKIKTKTSETKLALPRCVTLSLCVHNSTTSHLMSHFVSCNSTRWLRGLFKNRAGVMAKPPARPVFVNAQHQQGAVRRCQPKPEQP